MTSFLVYKASAGSGKTFTLAVHYIKLLVLAESPSEYSHILAVTFTNKATTEMKDRILCQLYGIGKGLASSDKYLKALRKAIIDEGSDLPSDDELRRRCRVALHDILHDYNRFRVQTIDSFFQTILRGLAHELGLTANLQVEISDNDVLSQAVDRLVDRLQDDPILLDWMMSLVRDQIDNNQRWDVTRKVKAFGSAIFNEDFVMRGERLRKILSDDDSLKQFIHEVTAISKAVEPTVKALGDALYSLIRDKGIDFTDFAYGKDLRTFTEKLQAADMTIEPSNRIQNWAYDPLTLVSKTKQTTRPDLVAAADEVSSLLSETLQVYADQQRAYNSSRLALAHIKKLRLLSDIDKEVAALNTENSRFNLARTPVLLNRMISENDAPFVFEKIGAALRHVIIDEFQDTSHLQWLNFQALLLETLAKGGKNLIVGDVKQSIYRFRGGDWRMLSSIENAMSVVPDVRRLDYNYRSLRNIIDFNNAFFEKAIPEMDRISSTDIGLLGEEFSFAKAYADVEQTIPEERPKTGYVRLTTLSTKDFPKQEDWQAEVIDDLIIQVRTLHENGLPFNAMTILVRKNFEATPIIDAFAAAGDLPAIISDEAFFFSSSLAIETIVTAMRVLTDEADLVSASFLATHYPEVESFDAKDKERLLQMPLYDLTESLCRLYALDSLQGQEAYLAAFFDALQDFVHNESSDVLSFLHYWDEKLSRQTIPAADIDGIRILTIHKSKGMEFNTVFIPFCCWPFAKDRADDLIWCCPDEKPYSDLGLMPITPSKQAANSAFANDYVREHLFARLDELNVLYVAFTRACKNLFIWATGQAEALAKPSATVGDLVASIFEQGYEIGHNVIEVEASGNESDNRLQATRKRLDVRFTSTQMKARFRQSNRSQQFLADALETDTEKLVERSRQRQYIELGSLLHNVLQHMTTQADMKRVLDALEHEGIITRTASDGTYVSAQRKDVENWIKQGFNNEIVSDWFSGRWNLFNECTIVSRSDSEGRYEERRPDRVMLAQDNSRVVVVDFKFGKEHSEYHKQVYEYMSLLHKMYPDAKVEGYLWFVYQGRVTPVTASSATAKMSTQMTLDF